MLLRAAIESVVSKTGVLKSGGSIKLPDGAVVKSPENYLK